MTKVPWQNVSKIQFYKEIRLGQNSKGILKRFTMPYCLPKWQYLRAKIAREGAIL